MDLSQGAWVDTKNGEVRFYHFQDADTYGRIVHLQPMNGSTNLALYWCRSR